MIAKDVLPGDRFGMLVALGDSGERLRKRVVYRWACDCGSVFNKIALYIKKSALASCGCAVIGRIAEARTKHGASIKNKDDPLYKTYVCWMSIRWRCTNKNRRDYASYGGRGIAVCERWSSFDNFLEDMGPRPDGLSIDRIDNEGDYTPQNCRWATGIEQARNKRTNRFVDIDGVRLTVSEWSNLSGVPKDTLRLRLEAGWPARDAVYAPVLRRGPVRKSKVSEVVAA